MTPEQLAWDSLRPVLLGLGLDAKRVENVVAPAHPDVDYTHGNIELKALTGWPKRVSTRVRIDCFTGEQAAWLLRRWLAGGNAWLMVRVERAWFLFDGKTAHAVYKGLTRLEWHERAAMVYPGSTHSGRTWGSFPAGEGARCYSRQLADWLRWDTDRMSPAQRELAARLGECRARAAD